MNPTSQMQGENNPLLVKANDHISKPFPTVQSKQKQRPPYLILPVIFGANAASSIMTTTAVEMLRRLSCQSWYFFNDPDSFPPIGHAPGELCRISPVEKLYATLFNVCTILDSVAALIAFTLIGRYAKVYGRRPSLLVIGFVPVVSTTALIIAAIAQNTVLQITSMGVYTVVACFANTKATTLLCTLFVVDTTDGPANRTAFLTFMSASSMAALTSGYGLGGAITRQTGSDAPVFIISLVISVMVLLYDLLVLPETFTPSTSDLNSVLAVSGKREKAFFASSIAQFLSFFSTPFAHIKPSRNFNGTRNFRLIILAVAAFFTYGGAVYIVPAFLLYASTALRLKANETGAILSIMTFSKVIFMLGILPTILSLRPWFSNRFDKSERNVDSEEASEDFHILSPSTKFDLLLLFFSLFMDSLAVAGLAVAASKTQLTLFMIMLAFGAGAQPILQSIVAASCEPSKSGEVLSAIQIVGAIAEIVSLVGLGGIMTATISTTPTLVFWLAAGLLATAGTLLIFVRDSDRWNVRSRPDSSSSTGNL